MIQKHFSVVAEIVLLTVGCSNGNMLCQRFTRSAPRRFFC